MLCSLGLLATQSGCLEIQIGNEPQQSTVDQTSYTDVAINPDNSPYYTEPLLPPPPIDLSSVDLASTSDTSLLAAAIEQGDAIRAAKTVLKKNGVVGSGTISNGLGATEILVLTKDAITMKAIPTSIDGKKTQVHIVGEIKAMATYNTRVKHRPVVPAGVSIGNGRENTSGTLGAVVVKNGIRYMLSNNHVLARQNRAQIGEQIVQPGRADTRGVPTDEVAILSAFKPVSFTSPNRIDAALARYTGYHSYSMVDNAFAPSKNPIQASTGMKVMKLGRTTGFTQGTIVATNVSLKVDFNGQTAVFENQIYIKGDYEEFLKAGDSGSLLVSQSGNRPVGLLFAGGEGSAFANPIQDVLNYFGVTIAGR